jgi:hypothetical protein
MTAHKSSTAYYVSHLVASWLASACKAAVRHQAVLAPSIRHSLTPCSTQMSSPMERSHLCSSSSVLTITTIGQPAPLKMHR